jgi:hypothetical protein
MLIVNTAATLRSVGAGSTDGVSPTGSAVAGFSVAGIEVLGAGVAPPQALISDVMIINEMASLYNFWVFIFSPLELI